MIDAAYHIIVIAVALWGVVKGFRRGFTGQLPGVLGFSFGIVCARLFSPEGEGVARSLFPWIEGHAGSQFVYSVLSAVGIYIIVYVAFGVLTGVLRSAMQVFETGILDRLSGAVFTLLRYLMVLSIVYNLILCVDPDSSLMRQVRADDGNVVEGVVLMAPGLLGCLDCEDLSHILQLREARKISVNQCSRDNVIEMRPAPSGKKYKIENA